MKTYTKKELIEALMSGKKMKAEGSSTSSYCFYDAENSASPFRLSTTNIVTSISMSASWEYTEWEELIEPKTVYEWMSYCTVMKQWVVSKYLYTESEAEIEFDSRKHQKTGRSWEV